MITKKPRRCQDTGGAQMKNGGKMPPRKELYICEQISETL